MKLQAIFRITAVASALVLAGCGGDIQVTPTVNDNSTNNSGNTSTVTNPAPVTPPAAVNPCAEHNGVQGAYDGRDC